MLTCRYTRDRSHDRPRILANRYEVVRKLGTGTFGTVFLVKDLMSSGELKVSKEISLGDLKPDETIDAIREAKLLSRLDHPGIVKYYDSFVDGDFFCIITEYCEGGDMADKIEQCQKSGKSFDESDVLTWFVQLLLAVQYMHSRRVLHRDIKTRNIFLKNNTVKLGDFGISRILMGTTDLASTFVGTPYFMSPEVLKHEGYNSTSDVWSVGCILYELCTHEHAFSGQSLMSVMYKITEGKIPDLPDRYSRQLNSLYKRMLQKNPKDRPSAKDITKLHFISEHINEMLKSLNEYKMAKNIFEENCQDEADDIAELLDSKSRLEDLITDSETRRLASLTPSQMLRLRKEMRADEEAHKLSEVAHQQLKQNHARKEAIRSVNELTHVPAWRGGQGDGEKLREALTVKEVTVNKRNDSRRKDNQLKNATLTLNANHNYGTHLHVPTVTMSADSASDCNGTLKYATFTVKPSLQIPSDERPITPMKNKMVYDLKNSSLDFKDGIPDEAELADTFYSQYDDFEAQADDDEDDDDESLNGDPDDMTLTPAADDPDKDVESLMHCLEGALSTPENESTIILVDDRENGAFGTAMRNVKIKNLYEKCEEILGKDAFDRAYNYLKQARYSQSAGSMDESDILHELQINPSDCYLIDQLLFLEEQEKISNWR